MVPNTFFTQALAIQYARMTGKHVVRYRDPNSTDATIDWDYLHNPNVKWQSVKVYNDHT